MKKRRYSITALLLAFLSAPAYSENPQFNISYVEGTAEITILGHSSLGWGVLGKQGDRSSRTYSYSGLNRIKIEEPGLFGPYSAFEGTVAHGQTLVCKALIYCPWRTCFYGRVKCN